MEISRVTEGQREKIEEIMLMQRRKGISSVQGG